MFVPYTPQPINKHRPIKKNGYFFFQVVKLLQKGVYFDLEFQGHPSFCNRPLHTLTRFLENQNINIDSPLKLNLSRPSKEKNGVRGKNHVIEKPTLQKKKSPFSIPSAIEKEMGFIYEQQFLVFFKKITNRCMCHGKKSKALQIVWDMLHILKRKIDIDFVKNKGVKIGNHASLNWILLRSIQRALQNISPNLEVRKVRVAGSTYIVPATLSKKKQETMALDWIIESAKKRQKNSKYNFSTCLADEFRDAFRKQGGARQKREELHRLAQANRAYTRYRWW